MGRSWCGILFRVTRSSPSQPIPTAQNRSPSAHAATGSFPPVTQNRQTLEHRSRHFSGIAENRRQHRTLVDPRVMYAWPFCTVGVLYRGLSRPRLRNKQHPNRHQRLAPSAHGALIGIIHVHRLMIHSMRHPMNPAKTNRSKTKLLTDLPNLGTSIAGDLQLIGIRQPED